MRYMVVFEQTPNNWSGYVPDLPGCIAAADMREETEQLIREGIGFYTEALVESGDPVPEPGAWTGKVEVDVPSP